MTVNKQIKQFSYYAAWCFLGLCAFILSLIVLAGTNWGLRLAAYGVNQSEAIHISDISGGLFTRASIGRIHVDIPDGIELEIEQAQLDIGVRCLLDLRACVEYLGADSVHVYLPPASIEESETPAQTQSMIELPMAFSLDLLKVEQIVVAQRAALARKKPAEFSHILLSIHQLAMSDVYAHQTFTLSSLNINKFLLFAPDPEATHQAPKQAQAEATGFSLALIQGALAKAPQLTLPEIFIPLNAKLKKASVNKMCWQLAQAQSDSADCVSDLHASSSVVEQIIDLELSFDAPEPLNASGIDAQSIYGKVQLDLSQNWQHEAQLKLVQAQVPAAGQQNSVKANGLGEELELLISGDLHKITLQLLQYSDVATQTLLQSELSGQWDNERLPLDVQLKIGELSPLNRFLMKPLTASVSQANVSIKGDWRRYKIDMEAQLVSQLEAQSGLSNIRLKANASPQNLQIDIAELYTNGALGKTIATGEIALDTSVDPLVVESQLAISLNQLNLAALGLEINSEISGEFSLGYEYADQWMRADMLCENISGQVQAYAFDMDCDVSLSKLGQLNIRALGLRQDENILEANGQLTLPSTQYTRLNLEQLMNTRGNLNVDINLPQLNTFLEDLSGQISLQGIFEGSLGEPLITLNSDIIALRYQDIALKQASLDLNVDAKNDFDTLLQLDLVELAIASNVIEQGSVNLKGSQSNHQLTLNLQAQDLSTEHRFEGGLVLDELRRAWSGTWNKANINLPFTRLTLSDQVEINADLNKLDIALSDHCWKAGDSDQTLCLQSLKYSDGSASGLAQLSYDVAIALRHYFPETVLMGSTLPLSSDLRFNYNAEHGLSASAYNRMIGGEIETASHQLALTAIVANMTVEQNILRTSLFAGTQQTGVLGLQSSLNLAPDNRLHTASIRVSDFDLSLLQRFVPTTHSMSGMVNADVDMSGELLAPQLDGYINIDSGELILDAYTYPLTNFNQSIQFSGQEASLQGRFNLGKGQAQYNADIGFLPEIKVKGAITGTDLQFAYQNNTAQISPNLQFAVSSTDLSLKGDIAIPSADIRIQELPENARTPSDDTIIIGQEAPEPVIPLALDIEINIVIDEPRRGFVVINALDLEAKLAGDLDLSVVQKRRPADNSLQAMRTLLNGQVDIIEGSYEAYGQMLLVQSGKIFFSGEPSLPQFNIRAIRNPLNTAGDVIAGVQITGNPVLPRVELFSEPPMIQAKQLSYLLQGQDIGGSSDGSGGLGSDTALINMLVNYGVGRSENRVGQFGRALGFDSLNVGTAGAGDNTQVQISGRISDNIQITYGIGVFDSASVVSLKYQILPQLFIEAKSGINSSVDLFYQMSRGEND